MKNEKDTKKKNDNFLKENGFLIALYSLVGILVVVALSLTFFMPNASNTGVTNDNLLSLEDSANVSNNLAKSYKTQAEVVTNEDKVSEIGNALEEQKNTEPPENKENGITKSEENKENTTDKKDTNNGTDTEQKDKTSSSVTEVPVIVFEDDQVLKTAQPTGLFTQKAVIKDSKDSDDDSDSDSDDDDSEEKQTTSMMKMIWPTKGEVVSVYSPTNLVYDPTLEQYRTNDSIDISAMKGQDVFAAYDGVVKTVSSSFEDGNYVVIDHGDGIVTTYSQLDDSMKVAVGDKISKGQQIGVIAEPTNNSVLLGTHLDFKVTKNDVALDPLSVLE